MQNFGNILVAAVVSLMLFFATILIGQGITGMPILEISKGSRAPSILVGIFLTIVSALFLYFRFQIKK